MIINRPTANIDSRSVGGGGGGDGLKVFNTVALSTKLNNVELYSVCVCVRARALQLDLNSQVLIKQLSTALFANFQILCFQYLIC